MPKSDPIFKKYGFGLDQMYGSGSEQNARIRVRPKCPDPIRDRTKCPDPIRVRTKCPNTVPAKIPGFGFDKNARIRLRTKCPDSGPNKLPGSGSAT